MAARGLFEQIGNHFPSLFEESDQEIAIEGISKERFIQIAEEIGDGFPDNVKRLITEIVDKIIRKYYEDEFEINLSANDTDVSRDITLEIPIPGFTLPFPRLQVVECKKEGDEWACAYESFSDHDSPFVFVEIMTDLERITSVRILLDAVSQALTDK